ncbi:MAG: hypothetical protein ACXVHX_33915 [Solirubrobacteraceae bacterium]
MSGIGRARGPCADDGAARFVAKRSPGAAGARDHLVAIAIVRYAEAR